MASGIYSAGVGVSLNRLVMMDEYTFFTYYIASPVVRVGYHKYMYGNLIPGCLPDTDHFMLVVHTSTGNR